MIDRPRTGVTRHEDPDHRGHRLYRRRSRARSARRRRRLSQRDLAAAISRMIYVGDRTDSLSLEEMFALGGPTGVSLSVNKRLASDHTRARLGWNPKRTGILADVDFGSYAARP